MNAVRSTNRRLRRSRHEVLETRDLLANTPLITEFMARNDGSLVDGEGDTSDWIEVYNPSDSPISLEGFHLTDDPKRPTRWTFPSVELPAGQFIVVFASGSGGVDGAGNYHTNFRLDADGEYLALTDPQGRILSEFGTVTDTYPKQFSNVSYGIAFPPTDLLPNRVGYMTTPTPGLANVGDDQVMIGYTDPPLPSVQRGFYDAPIDVMLSTRTPDSMIRYTTDGSQPTRDRGTTYEQPITIQQTTVLRAATFRDGYLTSQVMTHTFVMLDDVLRQNGQGLPETWGTFAYGSTEAAQGDPVPANYDVDSEIVLDSRYAHSIRDDLKSLPILSVVLDPEDLWSESRGIYSNPLQEGREWERAASFELFQPDGTTEFQVDAGVRIHGGFGRRPAATSKHSLRMFLRSEYGSSTLDYPWFGPAANGLDTVVLRANYNYSWARGDRGGSQTGKDYTLVTDRWAAETQRDMGGLAPHGDFVHLYLNGLYWGVYNPTERPDAAFQAAYRGGSEDDYDVVNHEGLVSGTNDAYRELLNVVRQSPLDLSRVEDILDLDNFIDYMILNQFGGNEDWPQNNWYASRRRVGEDRWQFHSWDAEFFFIDVNDNRVSSVPSQGPGLIFNELRGDPGFRLRFADRIYRHFYHQGALTPEANIERLDLLANVVDRAVVGESARWGDAWMNQVSPPRTRDDDWLPRINQLREDYFPRRHEIVLQQYRRARLLPATEAPILSQYGGPIHGATSVTVDHPLETAVVYFTRDGTDPRMTGGIVDSNAVQVAQNSIRVLPGERILMRALDDGVWSPLVDVEFSLWGDLTDDGMVTSVDVDALCAGIRRANDLMTFDLNRDQVLNQLDQLFYVEEVLGTSLGDANLDRQFDSADLVMTFQAGTYEDALPRNAVWSSGDWNCDEEFSTRDLVEAFQRGGYRNPTQAAIASGDIQAARVIDWSLAAAALANWSDDTPREFDTRRANVEPLSSDGPSRDILNAGRTCRGSKWTSFG